MTAKQALVAAGLAGSFIGGVVAGYQSRIAPAAGQDLWRDEVLKELGEIKGDVRVIKCRLGIEGICPPGEPK
jgi:hypothetical protein